MWTRFMDMHSGGGSKEKWEKILIEANEEEAKVIFYNRFGHNAERVSCTCCGEDYSISSHEDILRLTAYDRNCDWSKEKEGYVERSNKWAKHIPFEKYKNNPKVLFIYSDDISDDERKGYVPSQGYHWI